MSAQNVVLSKGLSKILRHNAGAETVDMSLDGYVDIAAVVSSLNRSKPFFDSPVSIDDVVSCVENDEKGRFQIADGRIRAMSGHSINVAVSGREFEPDGPLFFGTVEEGAARILESGFQGTKKKVRLSSSISAAKQVAAGRSGDPVILEVDAISLSRDGWRFTELDNGEIVVDLFPADYVKRVQHPEISLGPRGL